MSEIKQNIIDLAKQIGNGIEIDKNGNVIIQKDLYESQLPEGITIETLKTIQEHNNNFIAASTLTFGEKSMAVMKKNKEVDQIVAEIPTVGHDNLNIRFDRSRQVPDREHPGETKTKFGSTSVSYDMYGTSTRGQLKKVKAQLSEQALAAFGD